MMDGNWQQGTRAPARSGQSFGDPGTQPLERMGEVAVRSAALWWDLQMEAARTLWRSQARAAAMLGVPDWSQPLRTGDERAQHVFRTGAEQMLHSLRQVRETVAEVHRQIGRLAERQTAAFADGVGEEIEAMGRCTLDGLREIRAASAEEADALGELLTESVDGASSAEAAPSHAQPSQPEVPNQPQASTQPPNRPQASPAQAPSRPGNGGDVRRAERDEDNVQAASEALREARQGAEERRRRGSA